MNYINYDTKVVELYQTKLIGWTYCEFKSPFDIHTINNVHILLETLQCGRCCWIRMTKSDMNNHRDEVDKRKVAGETVGKARKPRSDKGIKRPWKKAPGVHEDDGNKEDDGAPPVKKQKRMKAAPEPHRKKVPKKSRKSQLPPTCPTSNEFIDSDADADADINAA
jgi:hypothetical protein